MDGTRNRGGNDGARHREADLATACGLAAQKGGLQPHRFRSWLNEVPDAQRDEKIRDGCERYARAPERAKSGERTISVDELTGVQALQRKSPDLPMQPGHILRREFEYIRHGESVVRWVAEQEGIEAERLGVKGKSGILQSMQSRATFLHDPTHKGVFSYTPKHACLYEPSRNLAQSSGAQVAQARQFSLAR